MIAATCSMLFLVAVFVVPLLAVDRWINKTGERMK